MEWYRKAAARGHAGALYRLGEFTEQGLAGLGPDLPKAMDYYRRAAEKGSAPAKEALERLSKTGSSVADGTVPVQDAPAAPKAPEKKEEEPKKKGGFFKKFFG